MRNRLISDADLVLLIDTIYENALDRDGWAKTSAKLTEVIRGGLFFFHLPNRHQRDLLDVVIPDRTEVDLDPYFDYYINIDPGRAILPLLRLQQFQWADEIMPIPRLMQTECYADFYIPNELFPGGTACIDDDPEFGVSRFVFCNQDRDPVITVNEESQLRPLLTHLRRAMKMFCRIRGAIDATKLLAEALDVFPTAVFVVRRDSSIHFANRAGRRLLKSRDGIRSRNRRLEGESQAASTEIKRAIHSSLDASAAPHDVDGLIRLPRGSGLRPLEAVICPVSGQHVDSALQRLVIVIVSDPEMRLEPNHKILAALYGLTTAESLLAVELANGKSLSDAAERLRITQNTARSRMKIVFDKTSTRRQSELVRLLLNGLAGRSIAADRAIQRRLE